MLCAASTPAMFTVMRNSEILSASLEPGAEVVHRLSGDHWALVFVVDGALSIQREDLTRGDLVLIDQSELTIRAWQPSRVVVAEMPSFGALKPSSDRTGTDAR